MSNPYQQLPYGSSSFAGDGFSSSNVPNSTGQRRPSSYASIVSGGSGGVARPSRAGAFSHLLNPSSDDSHASNLYSTLRNHYSYDTASGSERNGAADTTGDSGRASPWVLPGRYQHPHYHYYQHRQSGLPWFSRAFDMYMSRDPLAALADEHGLMRTQNANSSGFLSPSYLQGSVYLQKLEEAHRARMAAQREGHHHGAQTPSGAGALAGGSGGGSVGGGSSGGVSGGLAGYGSKLPPGSHRGVAFELVEKPPAFLEDEDGLDPLPSRWNKDDKWTGLDVLNEGYEVKYAGHRSSSDREHEACSIRADHFMPSECGVYYFEIIVLNKKREDTGIGIGFSSKNVALSRIPGWEPESWGYHGDDGHIFATQSVGKSYGPTFGPGDTVGCLVNFRLGHALFTKNGVELGIAFREVNFKDVKGKLYPTVGLKKPGDHVLANFGQLPFIFDIDGYMTKQKNMVFQDIQEADISKLAPPLSETELIQQLVLQFLQHDGYVETARAFAKEIHAEKLALSLDGSQVEGINIKDDEDANNRQRIRRAVLEGDIDRALKYTDAYYPQVLKENEQVYFRLRCRKFIEMIRREAEHNLITEKKGLKRYPSSLEDDEEMTEADGSGSNWDEEMDVEDPAEAGAGTGTGTSSVSKLSQEALDYGMELRREFDPDPRREVSKYLDEIFALIAYPNPLKVKEVAHLLDRTGRVAVAEELNSAILMSLGKSSRAALENLYAQTSVLLDDLRQDGGDGAFVTLQSVIDSVPEPSLL